MSPSLQTYALNKIISLGWVFVVIAISAWYFGVGETQWQFILLLLITFGYAHFIIGFYYQAKGFFRKDKPWQYITVFLALSLVSVIAAELLFSLVGFAVALFVGFAYFLLHGLFNEQTLIQREAGIHVPLTYISSLAVFIMALLTYSIPDPTFLFSRSLEFLNVDSFMLVVTFSTMGIDLINFTYVFWGGMILSYMILLWAWTRTRYHKLSLFLGFSYALIILATVLGGSMSYIYMYFLVIGYHFMTWFLFYVREMRRRPSPAFRNFMTQHAFVLAPFLIGGWLFFADSTPEFVYILFDYKYFVIATYAHISTSFMNDHWFQNLQNRLFGN